MFLGRIRFIAVGEFLWVFLTPALRGPRHGARLSGSEKEVVTSLGCLGQGHHGGGVCGVFALSPIFSITFLFHPVFFGHLIFWLFTLLSFSSTCFSFLNGKKHLGESL